MIHNSSSDPVLIKKISLKIWSLRDEIESRIQEKIDAGELVPENLELKIKELKGEYTKKSALPNNVLQLKSTDELPADGEDEMAKAMAEAMNTENSEESSEEENVDKVDAEENSAGDSPSEENSVEVSAQSNATAPSAELIDNNLISIAIEAPAQLPPEKIFRGKTILSEISMEKMFFFSNKAFMEGQSIVIQFCIPKTFVINADVIYCRPFNIKSRIISQNNYTHRMLIKFNFLKEGERALLRQFIQSIEPDVPKVTKKSTNTEEDSSESDFNELDDLGL
jgi:hypothetical protein